MRIVVTGSSGTIGTRLCEQLLKQGHEVSSIDWVPNKWKPEVEAITQHLDLRDGAALTTFDHTNGIDAVVHLAANARVYELVEHPDRARDNTLTLFNTLEFARTRGIPRFIFASSREVYGNSRQNAWKEDDIRIDHCESPYTASKLAGEAFVRSYTRCYGLSHVILRFSNVYGMYDDSERVVPRFIRLAQRNDPLTVYGSEKCLDFTYIDDTVQGILLVLKKCDQAKNEAYNIAFGRGIKILTLAEEVKRLLKSSSAIEITQPRTGEVIRFTADISKARDHLGYNPKVPFEDGIRRSIEWYLKKVC
jgi:UDP-glucose 4-epimerase